MMTIPTVHPPSPTLETTTPNFPILIDPTAAKPKYVATKLALQGWKDKKNPMLRS
ncbi:uncharacterized protein G2W53_038875 [Senna tora]|uniref:Uncharacterized protein n=1 Tax=Senna tora TaxID=362788 RepID=A0A834T0E0_9FABA|nr:uncharacterized protein G2W53_038875 [Senna tora]